MAVSVAVCEIFRDKNGVTLKTGLGFVQGHWKWHHLIDRLRVPISVQLFDWSKTARKIAVIAANATSKAKTALERTVAGLDVATNVNVNVTMSIINLYSASPRRPLMR